MDTVQATVATRQRDSLQKKLDSLGQQYREAERERATHGNLSTKRAKQVEELVGADDATTGYLHREIDSLDSDLRASSRLAEGLQNSLSRLTTERTKLHAEFVEAQEIAEQERRSRAFNVFSNQIRLDRQSAEVALDAARSALFVLNRTAGEGNVQHGEAGRQVVALLLGEFTQQQRDPHVLGWKDFGFQKTGDLSFRIEPMVKS